MNKRIVLVDDEKVSFNDFIGIGLETVKTITELEEADPVSVKDLMSIGKGDGIMVIGPKAFEFLKQFYHLGVRGENYYDCSILRRLGMEGGGFVKVFHEEDELSSEDVEFFNSPDFCKTREFPDYKWEVVKTYERALVFLDFFYNLKKGTLIGFDYETSGMAMERIFKITGAAFALAYQGMNVAVFFSFMELEKNCTPEQFQNFRNRFKAILVKHHENMWVYNMAFECQVTWREFGVELTFNDASVFNYEDGLHQKNFSLKWTAQRLLGGGDKYHLPGIAEGPGIEPWDTDFDKLEEAFSRLYWINTYEKGKKKPVGKEFKCSEYDWEYQPEWKEIRTLYPGYDDEFRRLVNENFGNPFLNMPADILGKYCCLDSFYTVLIAMENLPRYSPLCHETFQNNLHIYSMTERGGLFIDDDYRKKYERYCEKMMLWGILYVSTYRVKREYEILKGKAANINKYPKFSKLLIEKGEFCGGDPALISRNLLAQNVDPYDNYDTGLDEGNLVMKYGNEFASRLVDIVKESIEDTKFKGKIDGTVARKKKLLGSVSEKLKDLLEIDKIKFGKRHDNLESLLRYERSYKELMSVWKQVPNIDNVPDFIYWRGKKCPVLEVAESISEDYYRCSSPIDNVKYEQEFISEYKLETTFLATIGRDVNKLSGEKKFYENLGIKTPSEALSHFGSQCQIYYKNLNSKTGVCLWPDDIKSDYPISTFELFKELYDNPEHDFITETWGDWAGYDKQLDFFPELVESEVKIIGENWKESDTELDPFTRMRKLLVAILLYKKYNKILGTYICDTGIFSRNNKYVIEKGLMPIRDAEKEEPGAVKKSFVRYEVLHKTTKRSSGPFHKRLWLLSVMIIEKTVNLEI